MDETVYKTYIFNRFFNKKEWPNLMINDEDIKEYSISSKLNLNRLKKNYNILLNRSENYKNLESNHIKYDDYNRQALLDGVDMFRENINKEKFIEVRNVLRTLKSNRINPDCTAFQGSQNFDLNFLSELTPMISKNMQELEREWKNYE
jgi:hypothetical protein